MSDPKTEAKKPTDLTKIRPVRILIPEGVQFGPTRVTEFTTQGEERGLPQSTRLVGELAWFPSAAAATGVYVGASKGLPGHITPIAKCSRIDVE